MTYLNSIKTDVDSLVDVSNLTGLRTGFADQPGDNTYEFLFNDGTRLFTLRPKAPVTSFDVYYRNKKYTINASKTITISTANGLHFIYYNIATGLLGETTTFDPGLILGTGNRVFVAIIYWNNTAGYAPLVGVEGHTVDRNLIWHLYAHTTFGAKYESGGLLSGYVLDGSANTDLTFQMQDLNFYDEDLLLQIVNGTPSNDLKQNLRLDRSGAALDVLAQLPIIYRDGAGGVWKEDAPSDYAYKWDGTRLTVNQDLGGGVWGQVQVTQSDYCSVFIIATNDVRRPIKVVQGQVIYTSLASAQAGFANEIAGLGDFPGKEIIFIARILLQTRSTYGNARNAIIRDLELILNLATPAGQINALFDHATGTNLQYDVSGHTDFQRVYYPLNTGGVPPANYDDSDTAGIGIFFKESDFIKDTSTQTVYICTSAATGAAVWTKITP